MNRAAAGVVLPGATIGMVGGGQLGRMFAVAAASMGYRVIVLCNSPDEPAAQVAAGVVLGRLDDRDAVQKFASQCDVITLEFENIPADTMKQCSEIAPTYPSYNVLAVAQDRLIEKTTLAEAGLKVTPFVQVSDRETLLAAGQKLGWPLVVKTARDGYDGKGQYKVQSAAEVDQVDWSVAQRWIAEQWMPFEKEVSVVVATSSVGQTETFPVFENDHRNHILDVSVAPADVTPALADQARDVATRAAQALGLVGILCVEFFVVGEEVVINEVAPRPHNSGHLTIEGCHTSQFEQHVRAVCGLPLGSTAMVSSFAAMANLMGDLWPEGEKGPPWGEALAVAGVSLHLYGKQTASVGRKMGHLTAVGEDRNEVKSRVVEVRSRLDV